MSFESFLEDILFVIVLYKKRPEDSTAYTSLLHSVQLQSTPPTLFLYDNSPDASAPGDENTIYRHDPQNSGVAKAYNQGFLTARDTRKKWMLLLDQDTAIHVDFLKELSAATAHHTSSVAFVPRLKDRHGVVSPFRWRLGRGIRMGAIPPRLLLHKFRFLNSGLLVSTETFHKTGGYLENIPLYFSDIAFGEKLRQATDHFVVMDSVLPHGFSASENITREEALHRYSFFCRGALAMGRIFGRYWLYYLNTLFRGLKLSIQYKKTDFIKTFFNS